MALIEVVGAIKLEPSHIKTEPNAVVEISRDDIFQPSDEEPEQNTDKNTKTFISETRIAVDKIKDEEGCVDNNFCATDNLGEDERFVLNFNKQVETNDDHAKKSSNNEEVDWANVYRTQEETTCLEDRRKIKKFHGPFYEKRIQQEEYTYISETSFICNYCHRDFTTMKSLTRHIKILHRGESSIILQCPYCPKQAKWDLRYHIVTHHKDEKDIKWFQCYDCNKKFRVKRLLLAHVQTHLAKNVETIPCPSCEQTFSSKQSMQTHVLQVHKKRYQCEKCGATERSRWKLKIHIEVRHTDPSDLPVYHCAKCNFKTRHKHYLHRHCKRHKKTYICDKCGFTASTYSALKLHENVHKKKIDEETLRFRCKICDYKTYRHYSMQVHKLTHLKPEEVKYFYCYHCNFKAKRKDNLKTHIIRHFKKEEITFQCFICDFETKKRDALTKHVNGHENSPEINEISAL